jgi:hypothetical protein
MKIPITLGLVALTAAQAQAQHDHSGPSGQAGQAAFAAITEVVAALESDPSTDWTRVDLERLRQHLIDMDEVALRAAIVATAIPGGARFDATGTGRTLEAIRRMTSAHSVQPDVRYHLTTEEIAGGVRVTATSETPDGPARIRALGLIGLLASGGHHGPHHLALARGEMPAGHRH